MRTPRAPRLTPGAPHVRDAVDLHWLTRTMLAALAPCVVFGLYNTGYQVNRTLLEQGLAPGPGWRESVLAAFGAGHDPSSTLDGLLLGALHFVPLLAVAYAAGWFWERVFCLARGRESAPGLAVVVALFTASLPPTLPWWMAALGLSFGIVFGREIFGGPGRNVFHPAVVGLTFLYFAYPGQMRGDGVWVAVAGHAEPSLLKIATIGGPAELAAQGASWSEAFLGRIPGGLAETSALACLVGALILVHQRVASWRILLGVLLGAALTASLLEGQHAGAASWHLVLGSLAFGAVFLATDPVTSPVTDPARWVYGFLIGFLIVLIRVANPVHTEGVLLALLLGNASAPLLDRTVIWLHVRKRRRRLARA